MKKFSIVEASKVLGVSEQAIWKRIESGTLPYSKENGFIFVYLEEVNPVKEEPEVKEEPQPTASNEPSLTTYLMQQVEKKDEEIAQLRSELKASQSKVEEALKANSQLSQSVHLEARKLFEMMLPNVMAQPVQSVEQEDISPKKKRGRPKKKKSEF
jgi:molybdenum-dependent DNA-binding transcriptional regulator ModE